MESGTVVKPYYTALATLDMQSILLAPWGTLCPQRTFVALSPDMRESRYSLPQIFTIGGELSLVIRRA